MGGLVVGSPRDGSRKTCAEDLRDDLRDQRAVHVRQPHVAAVVAIRQFRVIQAEQIEHRRVEVVIRDWLLARLVAPLVARSD